MPYEIARILQDIAGGLMVTLPSAKDWLNPETAGILKKYLAGADGMSTYERVRRTQPNGALSDKLAIP